VLRTLVNEIPAQCERQMMSVVFADLFAQSYFQSLKYYSQFQTVVLFQNQTRNSIQIRSEKFH
jgi:hypothetical protein